MTKTPREHACAFLAQRIFDGKRMHKASALVVRGGQIAGLGPARDLPPDIARRDLGAGVLAPGFVDLQVNGGGGVMFNDAPNVQTLRQMADAHARLGAAAILPTLITDTPDKTRAAIAATVAAIDAGVPGILGLHLEGPHLALSRKGAHDPALIRPMTAEDLAELTAAAAQLPTLMVTLAPEAARPDQIAALVAAGAIVSLGHSDATYDDCRAAQAAGARGVTHLFNAMRPFGHREPGVVGAALNLGALSAGLIADGIHVAPPALALALRAKQGPGEIFLVSDAMATAGGDIASFMLNGRRIRREQGRLTLEDGTLAGADLDLARAVRVISGPQVGAPLAAALAMACSRPARFIGRQGQLGHLAPGRAADFLFLDGGGDLAGVWRGGAPL